MQKQGQETNRGQAAKGVNLLKEPRERVGAAAGVVAASAAGDPLSTGMLSYEVSKLMWNVEEHWVVK